MAVQFERREAIRDRTASRARYIQMVNSGEITAALTIAALRPAPGDTPETLQRLALLADGLTLGEVRELLAHATEAIRLQWEHEEERRRATGEEAAPEPPEPAEFVLEAGEHDGAIAELWEAYKSAVFVGEPPEEVAWHLRQAFYGGAAGLFATLMDDALGTAPEEAETRTIPRIDNELRAFYAEILSRQAAGHAKH